MCTLKKNTASILMLVLLLACCKLNAQEQADLPAADSVKPQIAAVVRPLHFSKYKQLKFAEWPMILKGGEKNNLTCTTDFSKVKNLTDVKVEIKPTVGDDSSTISIYKSGKLLKTLTLPFIAYYMDAIAYVADINKDGRPDIKFITNSGYCGLGADIFPKIYLFNQGNNFRIVFFSDFYEDKEYDLDNDGRYELVTCDHEFYNGHSYWVYNVYSYVNGNIVNRSKKFGYPLWTKHLIKTAKVIARNIPYKVRMKGLDKLADDFVIK